MLQKVELSHIKADGLSPDAAKKHVVVILGMHRSGTSVVTRLCNLLGMELGKNLLPPEEGNNDTGFWEHADIVRIHNELLAAFDSGWDDITPLPEGWENTEKAKPFKKQLLQVLERDFSGSDLWGVKDPRFIKVIHLWKDIFQELGVNPVHIIPLRNPYEVAESLRKRDGLPLQRGLMMWLENILVAEKEIIGSPRVYISYDGLLADWRQELSNLIKKTGIAWPNTIADVEDKINAFIRPGLKRNNQNEIEKSNYPQIDAWVEAAWEALQYMHDGNEEEGRRQIQKLLVSVWEPMRQLREVLALYYDELGTARKKMIEAYTALHERNLNFEDAVSEERKRLLHANAEISRLHLQLREMFASRSWRVTAPLRNAAHIIRLSKAIFSPKAYGRVIRLIRTHGVKRLVEETVTMLREHGLAGTLRYYRSKVAQELEYSRWIADNDTLTDRDRELIRADIATFAYKPSISVVMPVYNIQEQWLRAAIDSVITQLYPHWELCIADDFSPAPHIRKILEEYQAKDTRIKVLFRRENGHISEASNSALALATGDYIALLDHDDTLAEHALYHVAHAINKNPDVDLLYSDEDKINAEGHRFGPYFKSDWNPDLFYTQNMFCHLGVYRRSIIEKIGGFRKGYEGSQDYDLSLRALLHTDASRIHHIPRVLYHWRAIEGSTALSLKSKNYAVKTSRQAVTDYLAAAYPDVAVKIVDSHGVAKHKGYHRVVWPISTPAPKVSLLIPTRNGYALLKTCVESILAKTTYSNYEIIILNNQSDEAKTLEYFETLQTRNNVRILDYDKPFNFSAINNFGVANTDGEILGFINNDIEVITPDWLEEMVGNALRPEIGAVGAKLYYPDDTIQHGGVILGVGACDMPVAGHAFYHLPKNDPGYYARATLAQNFSAVTAACLLMRRDVFEEIKGFEEQHLTVAFNDIDLCLKVREKGYRNLWTPYAELYHHESATRGYEDTPEKMQRFRKEQEYMRERWGDILDNDPYYNPNLNIHRGDFSLAEMSRVKKAWV